MPRQFRPSVKRVLCVKTAERIIEILSLADTRIIQVFCHHASLRKSDGFTPRGGAEYKGGGSDFRPICGYSLSRKRRGCYRCNVAAAAAAGGGGGAADAAVMRQCSD